MNSKKDIIWSSISSCGYHFKIIRPVYDKITPAIHFIRIIFLFTLSISDFVINALIIRMNKDPHQKFFGYVHTEANTVSKFKKRSELFLNSFTNLLIFIGAILMYYWPNPTWSFSFRNVNGQE